MVEKRKSDLKSFGLMFHHFVDGDKHSPAQGAITHEEYENIIDRFINSHKVLRAEEWAHKAESNKLKLLHADTLFIHSTPNPSSDSETSCFGERNFECFPVPTINKSSDSSLSKRNKASLLISSSENIDTSSALLEETKQGIFS